MVERKLDVKLCRLLVVCCDDEERDMNESENFKEKQFFQGKERNGACICEHGVFRFCLE